MFYIAPDITSENPVISSNLFPNLTADHLQNAQLGAPPGSFIYAAQHPHSTYVSQAQPTNSSPYATIAAYPSTAQPTTIIPPAARPNSLAQTLPNNMTDPQQQSILAQQQPQLQPYQVSAPVQQQQQSVPILTSPKHDASSTKTTAQQQSMMPKVVTTTTTTTVPTKPQTTVANTVNLDLSKTSTASINQTKPVAITGQNFNNDALRTAGNPTYVTDLLSTSPLSINVQQSAQSLMSPISHKTPTASLNNIWPYSTAGTPLNLSQTAAQTAAVTAVAAMGLLNNDSGQNAEITNEILKELTTPTKQNK